MSNREALAVREPGIPMLEIPFDVIRCGWPQAVEHDGTRWTSDPVWDGPPMPFVPQPHWEMIDGQPCWVIDWREFFRIGLKFPGNSVCGEMCGFHVVFRVRPRAAGRLVFWADDGCMVRRDGSEVHCDRRAHGLERFEIDVAAHSELDIAHWQLHHQWIWAGRFEPRPDTAAPSSDALLSYLEGVLLRLERPNGPPLKMFCGGATPVCATLAIYSMILNGYVPERVLLYGEHQWGEEARRWFAVALPFAEVVPTDELLGLVRSAGGDELVALTRSYWYAMKLCVALLHEPARFCLMDDDVFVLAPTSDALERLEEAELVFAPDTNHGAAYLSVWGPVFGLQAPLPTGRVNTGLLWMRCNQDPQRIATLMLKGAGAVQQGGWVWEQGFVAALFAQRAVHQLPSQRYLCPLWDGLPGGILGYDYRGNPSQFIAVHFGGLREKPSDAAALHLGPQVLDRAASRDGDR
jgi:hypothetical protein